VRYADRRGEREWGRRSDTQSTSRHLERLGVDHGGADIRVTGQRLHRLLESTLKSPVIVVMSAHCFAAWVGSDGDLCKYPMPAPGLPHVTRVLQAMKPDESFDPIDLSFFGSEAVVQLTNLLAQMIQQPG
jgi:hypothetical protein